jgi:hypothetical protein
MRLQALAEYLLNKMIENRERSERAFLPPEKKKLCKAHF